jgi:3-deoxy-D-manno-octulosonate 8-phosphate phosphatase (KDO 8-P phosphatase)
MSELDPEVTARAARVRVVLMDVDGVLTDGRIYMGSNGYDGRSFHVRDGHGVRLGQRAGLFFGLVSGRESPVVAARAAELYITEVHQGVYDKLDCVHEVLARLGVEAAEACFVGDDLVDIPAMRAVGFAVAPADAVPAVLDCAHWVTRVEGGRGVVREVVDLLLRASGKIDRATERFLRA